MKDDLLAYLDDILRSGKAIKAFYRRIHIRGLLL